MAPAGAAPSLRSHAKGTPPKKTGYKQLSSLPPGHQTSRHASWGPADGPATGIPSMGTDGRTWLCHLHDGRAAGRRIQLLPCLHPLMPRPTCCPPPPRTTPLFPLIKKSIPRGDKDTVQVPPSQPGQGTALPALPLSALFQPPTRGSGAASLQTSSPPHRTGTPRAVLSANPAVPTGTGAGSEGWRCQHERDHCTPATVFNAKGLSTPPPRHGVGAALAGLCTAAPCGAAGRAPRTLPPPWRGARGPRWAGWRMCEDVAQVCARGWLCSGRPNPRLPQGDVGPPSPSHWDATGGHGGQGRPHGVVPPASVGDAGRQARSIPVGCRISAHIPPEPGATCPRCQSARHRHRTAGRATPGTDSKNIHIYTGYSE